MNAPLRPDARALTEELRRVLRLHLEENRRALRNLWKPSEGLVADELCDPELARLNALMIQISHTALRRLVLNHAREVLFPEERARLLDAVKGLEALSREVGRYAEQASEGASLPSERVLRTEAARIKGTAEALITQLHLA